MSVSLRLVLAAVLLSIAAAAVVLLRDPTDPGEGPIAAPAADPAALIARGEYLAIAGNCASCHTAPGGAFMAGGLAFETPFGVIHATNITPDEETGIGAWSARDLLDAMRHGVRPGGEHLYPVFPYTSYTRVTDADVAALHAYLQSLPPVRASTPDNDLPFPFSIRALMAFWKLLFLDAGPFVPDPERSASWNRGAYLVEALAHCSACHTPRNLLGAERQALALSGGAYLDRVPGGGLQSWSAPNLTGAGRGLGAWPREALADYLGHGRNAFLESFGPMNEVIVNSTSRLAGADIDAMVEYLKSLPAIEEASGAAPDPQVLGRGRTVYNLHCGTCHLPTGEGDPEMAPKLAAGSLVVLSDDPASMINAILYGPETPEGLDSRAPGPDWRHPMEDFQYLLDDEEIAAVATFVRHSWGNAAGAVTPDEVARQR